MKLHIALLAILGPGALHGADRPSQLSRILLHSTIRIEAVKSNGTHVGTGFFYQFGSGISNATIPVIVTCRHVVEGAATGRMLFPLAATNSQRQLGPALPLELPGFENLWINHPDTNVDLSVMPIGPLMHLLLEKGAMADMPLLADGMIPQEAELSSYGAFIDIWDRQNNLPIVRRGMSATDPLVDFNGRKEFLIDAAVFAGSSGSPVFIASDGPSTFGNQFVSRAPLRFLGIIYAVAQYTAQGRVEVITVPTALDFKAQTTIPAGLGLVIKAEQLLRFKALIEEKIRSGSQQAPEGQGKPSK